MTILKSDATWCVQGGQVSTIGPTAQTRGPQQCIVPQEFDSGTPAQFKAINEVQPLECVILYWAIRMVVNPISTDPSLSFRLQRNASTTQATITFAPMQVGVKAQLLSVPIFVNEHFNFESQSLGSGNARYTWLFAGKLTGTDPAG